MQIAQMEQWLNERKTAGLYRQTQVVQPLAQGKLLASGKVYRNFSGNDYLGLASDEALRAEQAQALLAYGTGSTGSPAVTGYHPAHQRLSQELCDWLGVDAVLLFSSGFAANQALISGLVAKADLLLMDKLAHASMIDAATQLPNGFKRFLHNDLLALERAVCQNTGPHVVATEGVFSMDGDSPPMAELVALCQQNQAPLLLDDAHGLGVVGHEGAGTMSSQGLENAQLQCLMANFGKALGAQGGFLAADAVTIDYLRQTSRHYIYSTALSPGYCEGIRLAIKACRAQQWRRDKLQDNIGSFRNMAQQAGISLMPSLSAIQPLIIGESERAMTISQQLKERGIWLTAIRPPTVPKGQARLRITLSSSHSQEDLQCLVQNLCQVLAI